MEDAMDFNDFDDLEGNDEYNDFNDEDHFYDDEIDNDIDEISNGEGSGEPDIGRTGLEWYEMAFLGGLAEELADEKRKRQRRRYKTDRNHFKRKHNPLGLS
jgi:hypothetical protein